MKPTRCLLIALLVLASAGCARRDWVSDMLMLADVTGTWTGSCACEGRASSRGIVTFGATFRQSGSRVTGALSLWGARGVMEVEGVLNGDVFHLTGPGLSADATVDGDEMSGRLLASAGIFCFTEGSSWFSLRRESSGRPGPHVR